MTDNPPLGGTTGHSHEHNAAVEQAALWLADQYPQPHPAVPLLRSRFSLSSVEACEAIAMARRFQVFRKAHG